MQLFKPPARPVAAPPPSVQAPPRLDAAAALFGGRTTTAVASNYQLRGVVASGTAKDSVAIISADGKPPQAIRANMEIEPGVKVQEIHRTYVLLSEGGVSKRVELPQDAKSESGADVATRSPMPTRPTPGQPQSAADMRRAAMMNQAPQPQPAMPPPQPAQPAQPTMPVPPPTAPEQAAAAAMGATSGSSGATTASGTGMPQPAAPQAVAPNAAAAPGQPGARPTIPQQAVPQAGQQLVPQQR
jgi:general secretion pathway protein C